MRLPDFILQNTESILREWEAFARSIWPGEPASPRRLRDHAGDLLIALASEMKNGSPESKKSENNAPARTFDNLGDLVSDLHAINRIGSGFDLQDLVAEYRALRKNLMLLWRQGSTGTEHEDLEDTIRFNEVLDRLLAEAVISYVRRIDRSREVFLAILGHDLRNPLQSLMVQSSILAQSGSLDQDSRNLASQMTASIDAMGRMIGDLLDFTGTQLGAKMNVRPAPMDLCTVCREVIDELESIHPGRDIIFQHEGNLEGQWDHSRLRQMISNLVGNALQHGFETTPIVVRAEAEANSITLSVCNQGPPIPPESAAIIFEPMIRQNNEEPCRKEGSIGLGLYIAREVANAHGGSISLHSVPEETLFTVILPRQSPAV